MSKYLIYLIPLILFVPLFALASTTNGTILTPYAWGDNVGYVNFLPDNGNIQITDSAITGFAWDSINGWLNFSPSGGGVSNDSNGNLSGSAWSAGAGWVDFSNAKINSNGKFTGTASGTTYGRLFFDCDTCNVTTDWRPQNVRPVPPTGSGFMLWPVQSTSSSNTNENIFNAPLPAASGTSILATLIKNNIKPAPNPSIGAANPQVKMLPNPQASPAIKSNASSPGHETGYFGQSADKTKPAGKVPSRVLFLWLSGIAIFGIFGLILVKVAKKSRFYNRSRSNSPSALRRG